MFSVTTNDESFITNATSKTLQKWAMNYTRKKLKEGLKLSQVKFTYKPVTFIPVQSKKFTGT